MDQSSIQSADMINPSRNLFSSPFYIEDVVPSVSNIIGREEEFARLNSSIENNNVVVITGMGGLGKSALAALISSHWEEKFGSRSVIWVHCGGTFSRTIDISTILLAFIYKTQESPKKFAELLSQQKLETQLLWLVNQLQKGQYLLILDNFESLLDTANNLLSNKTLFINFIDYVSKNLGNSRIIITSRYLPSFPPNHPVQFELDGLRIDAGMELLKSELYRRQVTPLPPDTEMILASGREFADGNPQFIIWLAELVQPQKGYNLAFLLNNSKIWQKNIADNLLNQLWENQLDEDERLLLNTATTLSTATRKTGTEIVAKKDKIW